MLDAGIDVHRASEGVGDEHAEKLQGTKSALPAMEDQEPQRVEKWKTSPGGPLERHVQTSSGENAQTSSGEHAGDAGSDLSDPNDDETNAETAVDLQCHEPVMGDAKRPRLRRHDVADKNKEKEVKGGD